MLFSQAVDTGCARPVQKTSSELIPKKRKSSNTDYFCPACFTVVLIFSVSLPKCPKEECEEELTSEDGVNVSS